MEGLFFLSFDFCPYLVIWEMTRSCALKCRHCRAEAISRRDAGELSTREAFALMDEIAAFAPAGGRGPLVVLTGGDPMRREDAIRIVEYGADRGICVAMTPSGTDEMTREKVGALKTAGLSRLAVSLDGADAAVHDSFRGVPGSFGWTLRIIEWAREVGLAVQINTTVTRDTKGGLPALAELLKALGVVLWSVFFLVPTGRGKADEEITAREVEGVLEWLAEISETAPFDIKTTEAQHYRRVCLQMKKKAILRGARLTASGLDGALEVRRAPAGVNAGKGFVFVSHTGEIYPSGFLPVSAGNVRSSSLVEVYRNHPLFVSLRDSAQLKGKCGYCEYRNVCGGSRARAYAHTGDCLAEEPLCAYQPQIGWGTRIRT